jgi:uncharacterized protein (DUF1684 family)
MTSPSLRRLNRLNPLVLVLGLLVLAATGCTSRSPSTARGPADWLEWQAKRRESLLGSNGWTTLIARYWLPEGITFVGSAPTNQLVLPPRRAVPCVGQFERRGSTVHFTATPGLIATIDGQKVQHATLMTDASNAPSRLCIDDLSFVIIERGDRLGLRVRDPQAPGRLEFPGLDLFPYDPAWRLPGRFEAFATPRPLRVPDILGGTQELISPGRIIFSREGREHSLDVVEEQGEEDYFVIFRDRTAGASTYGSGRFLYVARPGADGKVTIDFNRAYTPPCGFTAFATCPLPPPQNWLPFDVPAGEKKPRGPHPNAGK